MMKSIIYVAVVISWGGVDEHWMATGATRGECQQEEIQLRDMVHAKKEKCVSVYIWQYEKMLTYDVIWANDK